MMLKVLTTFSLRKEVRKLGDEKLFVVGIVTKVVSADDSLNKHHTPFSFANVVWTNKECELKEGEGISFNHSSKKVWPHESSPHQGSFVVLEEFELKRLGWRALEVTRLSPDEKIPKELREKLKNFREQNKEVRKE